MNDIDMELLTLPATLLNLLWIVTGIAIYCVLIRRRAR